MSAIALAEQECRERRVAVDEQADIKDADALGYAAFLAGELPSDNPYPYGAAQWQAWIMGFSEAQADRAGQ